MEEKISIRKNALDVAETVVSLLCLVGVVVYLILAWGNIPDRIPGHYNALGEVDHWSSKTSLIVLPIISWGLFGFITLVERYPVEGGEAWHLDLYRIGDAGELEFLGLDEGAAVLWLGAQPQPAPWPARRGGSTRSARPWRR